MKLMDKKGRTRVIALLSSLCGASFIALMCSIFAWFIPNNQLDNTHISGSLLRGYFHEASFQTDEGIKFSDGSKDYPYVITRPQHLYNLAHLQFEYVNVGVNKISFADMGYHFQIGWNLDEDEDLEVYSITGEVSDKKVLDMNGMTLPRIGFIDQSYTENENTAPTASNGNYSFKGTFLGNGFNICNFTIEGSFSSGGKKYYPKNIGFFGDIAKHTCVSTEVVETDQVSNFTLSDVTINTHTGKANATQNEKVNYVGYACGYVNEGKLSKVGVYNCRINCTNSYFRSNYTLIGEKNVSNSSLAESAPILDYAFDPHGVVSGTSWWDASKTSTEKSGTTCLSLDGKTFSALGNPTSSSYDLCGTGVSLNSILNYNYYDSNNTLQRKKYNQFTSSDNVSNLLYDPRVFDIYGASKMSNYTVKLSNGSTEFSTKGTTTIVTGYNNGVATTTTGTPTDLNGNELIIKMLHQTKYGVIQLDSKDTSALERKVVFKCDGKGKFLLIIIPNNSGNNGKLTVYKKNGTTLKSFYSIKLAKNDQSVPNPIEIPIEEAGEYAYSTNILQRIVYLRFIMQSEFGNTGGSGSVESVDYTYSTLEIPGSEGFILSKITIRFDSPSSKNVIIVVTREKIDTSDVIKISDDSKYFIGETKTNFTIINKAPANVTISYSPSS